MKHLHPRGRELGRKECRQLPRSAQLRRKAGAYHSIPGRKGQELGSQKDLSSSEAMKVLIPGDPNEEKKHSGGKTAEWNKPGLGPVASGKQYVHLNVSQSWRNSKLLTPLGWGCLNLFVYTSTAGFITCFPCTGFILSHSLGKEGGTREGSNI